MSALFFCLCALVYEPRYWLVYPPLTEIRSITASPRSVFLAVPDGVYILDRTHLHLTRTLTALDGIQGKITLAAYNPAHRELLIATDERLYQFLPASGQVVPLSPPFGHIRSIGITRAGAFFETDAGVFHKPHPGDIYQPAALPPEPVLWYGERDTTPIHRWTFLTPYFILDEGLNPCPFEKAAQDPYTDHLFVFARGYGILIYNPRTGFKEATLRLGPDATGTRQILALENKLWFIGTQRVFLLDSAGNWQYLPRTSTFALNLRWRPLLDLNREELITTVFAAGESALLVATTRGIHLLSGETGTGILSRENLSVNAIARIRDSLVLATDQGLFLLLEDSLVEITDPWARSDWGVFALAQTRGRAFFGTLGGVLELDTDNTWHRLIPPGFDPGQRVRALTAAANLMFIGTEQGLAIYNTETRTWDFLQLPFSPITALYADERYLWLTAGGMIGRYYYRAQFR